MASRNERLQKIVAVWGLLSEQAQDCIFALATYLLDETDLWALRRAIEALGNESPEPNATPL